MYIFEINLKNSPSAPCHNKEGREWRVWVCICVSSCKGQWEKKKKKQCWWTGEKGVIGCIFFFPPLRVREQKLYCSKGRGMEAEGGNVEK